MSVIVGLVGFASSGKDTVGQYLVDNYGFTSLAFADALKDCLSAIFGWDREMLAGRSPESRKWREEVDPWWANRLGIPHFSPRFAMQNFGTDLMRRQFHDEIWIINTERRILSTTGPIVISDARFGNEIQMLRRLRGSVYRVQRGPDPLWMDIAQRANAGDEIARQRLNDVFKVHQSEWAWIGETLNGTVENHGKIKHLYDAVEKSIVKETACERSFG